MQKFIILYKSRLTGQILTSVIFRNSRKQAILTAKYVASFTSRRSMFNFIIVSP